MNYGLNPFELGNQSTVRTVGIVDHLVAFDLGFAYQPLKWMDIGVSMAVLQVQSLSEEGQALSAARSIPSLATASSRRRSRCSTPARAP